jgi:hypothetical protein
VAQDDPMYWLMPALGYDKKLRASDCACHAWDRQKIMGLMPAHIAWPDEDGLLLLRHPTCAHLGPFY